MRLQTMDQFKESQVSWEAIWKLDKEYSNDVQQGLHRVIDTV